MNNTPNQNFDIRIPEPPEELKIKKRSKLPLILSLSAVGALIIAAAVIAAMLYAPLLTTPHWGNTFNKVFFNVGEMQAFSDSLSDGITADIDIGLKKEVTGLLKDVNVKLSLASKFTEDSESGSLTLALKEGENSLALSLIYDKDSVAIGVYGTENDKVQNDTAYVSIPRKNICEEFQNSVFAPESGSEFALEKEIFDEIVRVLETFEDLDKEPENTEKLEDPLLRVAEQIAVYVRPSSSISFSDSEFALVREISFTLTRDDMISIIDIIVAEAEANPRFAALLDPSYSSSAFEGTETSLIDILKEAKTELPECETHFSYSVSGDYVRNVKYSFVSLDDTEENMDAVLDFVYGEAVGCDLKITYGGDSDDSILYRKTDNDSELKAELSITSEGEEFKTSVTLNKTDDSLTIHANASDSPESVFEMRGSLKYDKAASSIAMSIASIQIGSEDPINDLSFGFEFEGGASDVSMPQAVPLFGMTANDLEALLTDLPKETFAKMLKSCTGEDLENYLSADGKLMLNAAQYAEIATAYANAYSVYLSNTEIMRADAVYIPVSELGINILLNYDQRQNMIFYNFAYNMTDELLKIYHPVVIDANGNLSAHNVEIKSDTAPTCQADGETIYFCSICDKTLTVKKDKVFHTWNQKTLTFTADNGEKHSLGYSYCSVCSFISNFEIVGQMSASFIYDYNKGTYTIESYNNSGTIEKYYGLPSVFDDLMIITDVKAAALRDCISVRIPYGIEILHSGRFRESENVQVLILPSTLKEIKKGAFSSIQKLHTIFYCGTEADWKNVELGDLKDIISNVNVIFCPQGAKPAEIQKAIMDPDKCASAATASKNKIQKDINAAREAAKKDNITLIHKNKVESVIYDEASGLAAVCDEYNGKETVMSVYDIKTGNSVASFKVSADVALFDIKDGHIAYACADSTMIYIYNLTTKQTISYKAPSYSDISWDSIAAVYIHKGKVYTSTVEQHCYLSYYDLATGEIVKINQILYPSLYINRELDRIVNIKTTGSPKTVEFYDLSTNSFIKEIWLENRVHYITFMGDYLVDSEGNLFDLNGEKLSSVPEGSKPIEHERIDDGIIFDIRYAEPNGNLSLYVKKGYKICTIIKDAKANSSPVVLDYYAEEAIVTENGDFLIYTPGGYGLLLVNID